jgi:hypothetical protein
VGSRDKVHRAYSGITSVPGSVGGGGGAKHVTIMRVTKLHWCSQMRLQRSSVTPAEHRAGYLEGPTPPILDVRWSSVEWCVVWIDLAREMQ